MAAQFPSGAAPEGAVLRPAVPDTRPVDWLCETLQIVTGGAPLVAAWAITNQPAQSAVISGVCAAAAYVASRYLRLCIPQ